MRRGISAISRTKVWPFLSIIGWNAGTTSRRSSPTSAGSRLNESFPRSIFERSSTSFTSCRSILPLDTIMLRACFASSGGTSPACKSSEKPMMALSGVRMSCETAEEK